MVDANSNNLRNRPSAPMTRPSLLLRVRNLNDAESWREFIELYGPLIMRYLKRKHVPHDDAVELTQEVLQIVATHIAKFEYDPARGRFRGWLWTVAKNLAI